MQPNNTRLRRSRLSAALLAALLLPAAGMAFAQDTGNNQSDNQNQTEQSDNQDQEEQRLEKIVVTGSLIPQSQIETYQPVTTITAEAIAARGYSDVHDVLVSSSFATGRVQGGETSFSSFTKGAQTMSMFGLDPGFVKYLINGVPMVDYPALYNGSDAFNNISGIPTTLVQRIDILPGGQSSLYGSDAIAGVVNIILKDHLEGGEIGARYGWFQEGGGTSKRLTFAYGDTSGDFDWLVGAQWEQVEPVWTSQRDITSEFNEHGFTPQAASRDFLVFGPFIPNGGYIFLDPDNCADVRGLWNDTESIQTRLGRDYYCGSMHTPGYRTVLNGKDSKQAYLHASYDFSNGSELYGTLLYNHEQVQYQVGASYTFWATGVKYGYIFVPGLDGPFYGAYGIDGALVNLQHAFAPEEIGPGGFKANMSTNFSTSYMARVGWRGNFGDSAWRYNVNLQRGEYELIQGGFSRIADKIDGWFQENILGPQLGVDPLFGNYPVFQPNWDAFYEPLNPAEYWSFMEWTENHSETYTDLLRGQLTNGYLFSLPGGDAGLALVAEYGRQGWTYNPDPRLLNGEIWGTTGVSGSGEQTRYALTGELRLPLFDMLTVTASGRYDKYDAEGNTYDKPTYSVGVEFRPFTELLFRGKYGTAFRAPSLPDLFQGTSGFYTFVPDYYRCYTEEGIEPTAVDTCRYGSFQILASNSGNSNLKPINADTWNVGVVWAPTPRLSFSVDYYSWEINDETTSQSVSGILLNEYRCAVGELDPGSPLCAAAEDAITRNADGSLETVEVHKINIAKETVKAIVANASYLLDAGSLGKFRFSGSYTNMREHTYTQFPGDEPFDLLNDPYYSTDPKVKGNVAVSWQKDIYSATLFANYIGHTPNNILWTDSDRFDAEGAGMLDPWTTYNLSLGLHPTDDFDIALRISNLLNKMPDMDLESYSGASNSPYNWANFSIMGRRYYIQANWRFGNN